jgi:hypothetical protein
MFRNIRAVFATLTLTSVLLLQSAMAQADPKVEIFSNQQPILIGLNQQTQVTLLGAVYDDSLVNGAVNLVPNGPQNTACPIFVNGLNSPVNIPGNTMNVQFRVLVQGPSDPQQVTQTFTCGLTYSAAQVVFDPVTGRFVLEPVRTLGNEVRFQYTVKRRPQ